MIQYYAKATKTKKNKKVICPNCHYVTTIFEIESARYDFDCPVCGKFRLTQFIDYDSPTWFERFQRGKNENRKE